MALNVLQFGEAFARNCLRKFYNKALTPVVANTDYEGEVKAIGDRVNILMFLDDITLSNYAVGTNMGTQHPVDTESILQIDRAKYWNFDIDTVDSQFTYVNDEDSTLIENAARVLEKEIDTELLRNVEWVQAGHIVPNNPSSGGVWNYTIGSAATFVTITTAASWGIMTLTGARGPGAGATNLENCVFPVNIIGRGIRICSSNINSPWYRITARTSSTVLTFNNWDGSTTSDGQPNVYVKSLWLGGGLTYGGTCGSGYGAQIEGCKATAVTSANIYQLVCELAGKLDEEGIPAEDRHLVIPAWFKNTLTQAAQLQPDIAMYYTDTVINGKVGRVAGFDLHLASDSIFSTCASPMSSLSTDAVSTVGTCILANHRSWITFAHKWAESRVVIAELQFAKLYQGLNLYGFRVPNMRRSSGAYLFGARA